MLHQIVVATATRRPIIYRASIAEMVVPYGDPSPVRFWQNYFDTGEYLLGQLRQLAGAGLRLPRRDPYFDAVIADELRQPARPSATRSACTRRTTASCGSTPTCSPASAETRRQRRLVISFFTTIGNYDYGFYWYLYLDGTIELEAKATGIVFTSRLPRARHAVRHRDRARAWARRSTSTCSAPGWT